MKNLKPILLLLSLILLSHLSIAQYPKRIIGKDTVVVMTQNQSVDINKLFKKLKNEGSQNKMRADSLSIMLDTERNGFSRSLENAQNAYMLSEEENEILRETHICILCIL